MIELYLDYHSKKCVDSDSVLQTYFGCREYCEDNPERFMFYLNNEFYIITYHSCIRVCEGRVDFNISLIDKVIKNYKVLDRYLIEKFIDVRKELSKFRQSNARLRKHIQQVNYMYSQFGKELAITTKCRLIDAICNESSLIDAYDNAVKYLNDNGLKSLLEPLKKLYDANRILYHNDAIEHFKTIDCLVDRIKKK